MGGIRPCRGKDRARAQIIFVDHCTCDRTAALQLRSLAPECPPELEAVVNRLLEKEREHRYQSMEDLLLDIGPILGDLAREQ